MFGDNGTGMGNVLLWAGNLLLAGSLPLCVCRRGKCARREWSRGDRGAALLAAVEWFLEFAVYSAGVIRLAGLVMGGIEAGGTHSLALSVVGVFFAESMALLFLVLSMPGTRREDAAWSRESGRGTRGESFITLFLLLALTLRGFGERVLWRDFAAQILLLFLLFILLYLKERGRKRQEEKEDAAMQKRQADYQKSVDVQYQRTRELWHDLKNHIGVLEILAKEGRSEELADYLGSFRRDVENRMIPMKTGSAAVDAILSDKLYRARREEIEVHMQICDLSEMNLSTVDLCAVLGNLLDNAIEACGRLSEKGRIILYLRREEDFYYLTVANTAREPVRSETGFVSGKKGYDNGVGHGMGLRSVERIAHSCGGSMAAGYGEGEFKVVVRLQGRNPDEK